MQYTKKKETDPEIRRRELVEGHVTAIEKANKLSLIFQNYLIKNPNTYNLFNIIN